MHSQKKENEVTQTICVGEKNGVCCLGFCVLKVAQGGGARKSGCRFYPANVG